MEMRGEYRIPAPRERVWTALNDPEILKASIPGCQSLERHSPTEMTARVVAKIGPVKANFVGRVTLSDLEPPARYTISGEGQGGVAGFAKGGAGVSLAEDGDETVLTYEARAQIGGKLAQLGARLIDSTAKSMADQFFARFSELAAGRPAEGGSVPATTLDERPAPEIEPLGDATPFPGPDIPVSPATERAREDSAGPSGDPLAGSPAGAPVTSVTPVPSTRSAAPATPADAAGGGPDGPYRPEERSAVRPAAAPIPSEASAASTYGTEARMTGTEPPPIPKREIPRWAWIAGGIALALLVIAALD